MDEDTDVTPAAPTPVRKTAEEWAIARGHFKMVPFRGKQHRRMTFEFAAAKALHGWPIGKELTADEYDKAVHAATHEVVAR